MDIRSLRYSIFGGVRKNLHLPYYIHGYAMMSLPRFFTERRRESLLREFDSLPSQQQDYVMHRVDYYNRLSSPVSLPSTAPCIGEQSFLHKQYGSVYLFDSYEWTRYFPCHLHWLLMPGDVIQTFSHPTVAKSRPIGDANTNGNSVLLNMDKVRHFVFFRDPVPFDSKHNQVIFRGAVMNKPARMAFLEQYFGRPLFDLRDTSRHSTYPPEMRQSKETTIYDHLSYKYIMCLEGNDVASNLKWVMHSNSLAVAPAMRYETWFMEGTLRGNEHFIEIKPDYSDIEERLSYYNDHPLEARDIVENAHRHCRQFLTPKIERLCSLMVMEKYFRMTDQQF